MSFSFTIFCRQKRADKFSYEYKNELVWRGVTYDTAEQHAVPPCGSP